MHIDDEPSFLGGNGLPYEFAAGEESSAVEANVSSPTAKLLARSARSIPSPTITRLPMRL